ncbi:hypothetical protein ES703_69288 [subsurface metagenome]
MKLEKAIEILGYVLDERPYDANDDGIEAIKLGIEAMKRLQHTRDLLPLCPPILLPGETED